jgi:hypothetical protein
VNNKAFFLKKREIFLDKFMVTLGQKNPISKVFLQGTVGVL